MKTIFPAIILLLCSLLPAMAQAEHDPFHPMLQDGKMWHIDYSTSANIVGERHYIHYIDGDTVIEGQTWKKVYSNQATRYMEGNETTGNHYFAAMREVGNKIYAIAAGLQRPRLIYDFDMKVGDYVHHGYEQIDLQSQLKGIV